MHWQTPFNNVLLGGQAKHLPAESMNSDGLQIQAFVLKL
jgi:hypothetical protein